MGTPLLRSLRVITRDSGVARAGMLACGRCSAEAANRTCAGCSVMAQS